MSERVGLGRRIGVTLVVGLGMGCVVGLIAGLLTFAAEGARFALTPSMVMQTLVAAVAGGLLAAFFGRVGILGWLLAVVAGAVVTLVAAVLTALIGPVSDLAGAQAALDTLPDALPRDLAALQALEPTAIALPLALIASPFLGMLWVALVSAVHAAAGGARTP